MVQGRRPSEEQPTDGLSIGSVVLGALGMIAWCIPLCGCPVSIVGLVLGIQAYLKGNRTLGVVGIVLCSLGLALTLIKRRYRCLHGRNRSTSVRATAKGADAVKGMKVFYPNNACKGDASKFSETRFWGG
jgi:ABC-type nickel/cobalt efflux system permease component RcnA